MNPATPCKQKGPLLRNRRPSIRRGSGTCLILFFAIAGATCDGGMAGEEATTEAAYRSAREAMVVRQIEARGIRDPLVLNALRAVPRHRFVPKRYRSQAYRDGPLPIGHNQTISQPYIVALMTELLRLQGGERVLEVGTGSGYQAAVLAKIAGEVYSIEIVEPICRRLEILLPPGDYPNLRLRCGDGYRGWPDRAPFDAILVTAAPPAVPPPLLAQLKPGGRLVVPVGDYSQELMVYTRTEDGFAKRSVIPVRFVPMTGEAQKTIDDP